MMIDELRTRANWIERNVLRYEMEIRTWLGKNCVRDDKIDDIIQEMYTKISSVGPLEHIRNPRQYAMNVAQSIMLGCMPREHRALGDRELSQTETNDQPALHIAVERHIPPIGQLPRKRFSGGNSAPCTSVTTEDAHCCDRSEDF